MHACRSLAVIFIRCAAHLHAVTSKFIPEVYLECCSRASLPVHRNLADCMMLQVQAARSCARMTLRVPSYYTFHCCRKYHVGTQVAHPEAPPVGRVGQQVRSTFSHAPGLDRSAPSENPHGSATSS